MAPSEPWISNLRQLLYEDEFTIAGYPYYAEESKTWAAQKDLKPRCIVRPHSAENLSRVLAFLNDLDLHFGVRSGGVGSGSAKDVLISLSTFNEFALDLDSETLTIGTGQTWGEVDQKLADQAPEYSGLLQVPVILPVVFDMVKF